MKHLAVLLLCLSCAGCLKRGLEVDVEVTIDPCVTSYPECTADGGFFCVDSDGVEQRGCQPECLAGLEPPSQCDEVTGGCYNYAAGQTLEVPLVCVSR